MLADLGQKLKFIFSTRPQLQQAVTVPTVIETNSLYEQLVLAEAGAKQRADRAKAALAQFHLEFGNPRAGQMWAESFPHHDSLLRKYHALLVEEDDACRNWSKAQNDLCVAKRAAGLTTTLAQGAKTNV